MLCLSAVSPHLTPYPFTECTWPTGQRRPRDPPVRRLPAGLFAHTIVSHSPEPFQALPVQPMPVAQVFINA